MSAGACFNGTGRLHSVADKAKINADYYVRELLPKLVNDCKLLMPDGYTFQQDDAPVHTSRHAQDWLKQNTPDFIRKDEWSTPQILIRSTFTSGERCHTDTSRMCRNLKTSRNCEKC